MNLDALKRFALRALARMGDQVMSHDTLRDSIHIGNMGLTTGDIDEAIDELEADGYISGSTVELVGVVWLLTPKGRVKAAQLH